MKLKISQYLGNQSTFKNDNKRTKKLHSIPNYSSSSFYQLLVNESNEEIIKYLSTIDINAPCLYSTYLPIYDLLLFLNDYPDLKDNLYPVFLVLIKDPRLDFEQYCTFSSDTLVKLKNFPYFDASKALRRSFNLTETALLCGLYKFAYQFIVQKNISFNNAAIEQQKKYNGFTKEEFSHLIKNIYKETIIENDITDNWGLNILLLIRVKEELKLDLGYNLNGIYLDYKPLLNHSRLFSESLVTYLLSSKVINKDNIENFISQGADLNWDVNNSQGYLYSILNNKYLTQNQKERIYNTLVSLGMIPNYFHLLTAVQNNNIMMVGYLTKQYKIKDYFHIGQNQIVSLAEIALKREYSEVTRFLLSANFYSTLEKEFILQRQAMLYVSKQEDISVVEIIKQADVTRQQITTELNNRYFSYNLAELSLEINDQKLQQYAWNYLAVAYKDVRIPLASLLHKAVKKENETQLIFLLQKGAPDLPDKNGNYALYYAYMRNTHDIIKALENIKFNLYPPEIYIKIMKKIEALKDSTTSLLHQAVKQGDLEKVKELLEKGYRDLEFEGCYALTHSFSKANKNDDIYKLLKEFNIYGSAIEKKIHHEASILYFHQAAKIGDIDWLKKLISNKVIDCQDNHSNYALYYALIHNNLKVVRFLTNRFYYPVKGQTRIGVNVINFFYNYYNNIIGCDQKIEYIKKHALILDLISQEFKISLKEYFQPEELLVILELAKKYKFYFHQTVKINDLEQLNNLINNDFIDMRDEHNNYALFYAFIDNNIKAVEFLLNKIYYPAGELKDIVRKIINYHHNHYDNIISYVKKEKYIHEITPLMEFISKSFTISSQESIKPEDAVFLSKFSKECSIHRQ